MKKKHFQLPILLLAVFVSSLQCIDFSDVAFGSRRDGLPAAFGDFNSDELTDLFIIRKNTSGSWVEILLGSTKEPYFIPDPKLVCSYFSPDPNNQTLIVSVVPGDFDGDALMDMLVITHNSKVQGFVNNVYMAWGNVTSLICDEKPLFQLQDEPLVIDYSQNMKADLFGVNITGSRVLWLFDGDRTKAPRELPLMNSSNAKLGELRIPHSHAFLDFNGDNWPDLYLTSNVGYEIWLWDNDAKNFFYSNPIKQITIPDPKVEHFIGQTLFMDLETADQLNQIVPFTTYFHSSLYVYLNDEWIELPVNFQFGDQHWIFAPPDGSFPDTITLHAGDFNNDGFVDMLATLAVAGHTDIRKVFLFENVPCTNKCKFSRTFEIQWNALTPYNEGSIMGIFYDFMQDGILDIIFVQNTKEGKKTMSAFKNGLDYDANFIKVMVITGLTNDKIDLPPTLLGTKRHVFGSNLPGPKIRYKTTTQDGNSRTGVAIQLPQSAHFALYLPYTIFGLGRTPNFIEDLTISLFNKSRTWNQIIPNSQLIVAPRGDPSLWTAQLFVTPSKIVLQTVVALTGTCIVIGFIIAMLHWKERKEDRIERLQEAHRFHFDAM